jgi:uncharacterized membrane protein
MIPTSCQTDTSVSRDYDGEAPTWAISGTCPDITMPDGAYDDDVPPITDDDEYAQT